MSDEQLAKWLPLAKNYSILGCYAQTELGHGSNLRKLETTAHYIPETDEIELHSPTLTSMKWWPGALGRTSNFAAVYARLILPGGQDLGAHPILVQIRSLKDHSPMPGCEIGDIGPKIGFNSIDNGFLRLTHVRVPRDQLMMRNATLDRQGHYSRPIHNKLVYATMVSVRADIIDLAGVNLSKALAIAVRYSIIRRQGDDPTHPGGERQVLDYQQQQHTVFTNLALAYALHFTGRYMREMYEDNLRATLDRGDVSRMQEVHATSSGLKAVCTDLVCLGIENLRRSCGGHGYSHLSGLPWLYEVYLQYPTVEGENTILHLQTSRFLLKSLAATRKGDRFSSLQLAYLNNVTSLLEQKCQVRSCDDWLDPIAQLDAFWHRDALVLSSLADRINAQNGNDTSSHMLDMLHLSRSHIQTMIVHCFQTELGRHCPPGHALHRSLKRLSDLHALFTIHSNLADFLLDGYVSPTQAAWLQEAICALLLRIRPDAVGLVDAFEFSDNDLASAIGRYDGDVYNALYEWAKMEPMNIEGGRRGYSEVLQGLLRQWPVNGAKL